MDYLFSLIDIPWPYYLIAIGIVVVLTVTTKKWEMALLVGYMFLVLTDTVLIREAGELRYELLPFWSYRDYFNGTDGSLMKQIVANVVMFIPRGLFEFDDILHNTIGTVIGVAVFMALRLMWRKL